MKELGVCKLCREEKPLLKKSHVIQKSLIKSIKGGHEQIVKIKSEFPNNHKLIGDCFYEPNILCENCDNVLLGAIEKSGKFEYDKIISTLTNSAQVSFKRGSFTTVSDVNYKDLKLWVLIHLWRMSISKQQIFDIVSLGTNHEETIRLMIINQNIGVLNQYPFVIASCVQKNTLFKDIILRPEGGRVDSYRIYSLYICGLYIYIFVCSSTFSLPIMVNQYTTKATSGTLDIIYQPVESIQDFIYKRLFQK